MNQESSAFRDGECQETKAHDRKDALDVFRENFGTLSTVDFIEKGKC